MFWTASSGRSKLERCKNQLSGAAESRIVEDQTIMKRLQRRDDDDDHDHDGVMKKNNFCTRHVRDPCRSFGRRCSLLVKEQRARFYILRRCITMLLCWHERGDP